MPVTCTFCDTTCPETVDVTVVNNTGVYRTIDFTNVAGSPITMQVVDEDGVDVAGRFAVFLRIIDDPDTPNIPAFPTTWTTPTWIETTLITEDDGSLEFAHGIAGKYVMAAVGEVVVVSAVVT